MKDIHRILLAATLLVTVGLACGSSDETPTPEAQPTPTAESQPPPTEEVLPTPTEEPQPTPKTKATLGPKVTSTPEAQGATLEIINESGADVWYVYISPSDAGEWGDDWLGGDTIPDGESYVIAGIPEGTYDVRAVDAGEMVLEEVWAAELEGDVAWTLTGLASLEVVNESLDTIAYLYISPSDSAEWGQDWLGQDVIDPGGDSYVVEDLPLDTYDVKVENLDAESVETVYSVDLSGANTWSVIGKTPVPDDAALRFEDDFTDNRNDWGATGEEEDVNYMRPADGEYCMLIKSDQLTAWEWYEPFRTDEFVAEVSCRLEGAEDASCGLGFGPDGDNLYWFEISPFDQSFALFLLEGNEWQDNLVDWTVSKNIDPHGTNYLSMQRVRGVVSLYVNGVLVEQVDSDRFPTGRLGIGGSTYDDPNATVCLDNLRVWRLE